MNYEIRYSSRRKTLGIVVERDGRVVVTAPEGIAATRIVAIVEQKRTWIEEKQKDARKYPEQPKKKEFVMGETLLYLGHPCPLVISKINFPGVAFRDGTFSISCHSQAKAYDLLKEWYKNRAWAVIDPLAREYATSLGVTYSECCIKEMHYRWASCTPKGNLCFNWRAIKAPMNVIHYLVVHELAHLIEPNHTPKFWNIVAVQLPQYAQAKDWLAKNGNEIEIDF